MTRTLVLGYFLSTLALIGCSGNKLDEKGFSIHQTNENDMEAGISEDSLSSRLKIRPSNVLLTGIPEYRLVTVYKVNYSKKKKRSFIGSNNYHSTYGGLSLEPGNAWHHHYMPGLEAVYGYNMLNIAHYNTTTGKQTHLFDAPVLIKTLYYPSFVQDTLNYQPVNRDYLMISVYDEDTNGDSLINIHDLRRFYHFDIEGQNKTPLVPLNYSVISSEYDPENDRMYIFAKMDKNANGKRDENEDMHIFWVDLKEPGKKGRLY